MSRNRFSPRIRKPYSRMSLTVLMAITMYFIGIPAMYAEETWYEAYKQAIQAIEAKDWPTAESRLTVAKRLGPQPGKNIRAYGVHRVDFFPDYYLGVVYYNLGKKEEAAFQFDIAEKSRVFQETDPEFLELRRMLESMSTPPDDRTQRIARMLANAETFVNQGQLEAARSQLRSLQDIDPTNAFVAPLQSRIAKIETDLRTQVEKMRTPAEIARMKETLEAGQIKEPANKLYTELLGRLSQKEQTSMGEQEAKLTREFAEKMRRALLAFYSGNYDLSQDLLDQVSAQKKDSAKVYFYLACTNAAMALLAQAEKRTQLLEQARRQFAQARTIDPNFHYDEKFISPRIISIYQKLR